MKNSESYIGERAFAQRIAELNPVWAAARQSMLDPSGDGGRLAPPTTLSQFIAGGKGVQALMAAGPGKVHVDSEHGLLLSLNKQDTIDRYAADPFEQNWLRIWCGDLKPSTQQVESLRQAFEEARLNLTLGKGQRQLKKVVGFTAGMPEMGALTTFLQSRIRHSFIEQKRSNWTLSNVTQLDRLADCVRLQAELAQFSAAWYRRVYLGKGPIRPERGHDLVEAFVHGLGAYKSETQRQEQNRVMRVLFNIMPYHGSGNLSTAATIIAGSGGASPYYAYSAGLMALVGPNHGGAAPFGGAQMFNAYNTLGPLATDEAIQQWCREERLAKGEGIMTLGHRLLRGASGDPRARAILHTLSELYGEEEFLSFAQNFYGGAKKVVASLGKVAFPEVNVDGYTAVALKLAGIIQDLDQVGLGWLIFGNSRVCGALKEWYWWGVPKEALLRFSPILWFDLDQFKKAE